MDTTTNYPIRHATQADAVELARLLSLLGHSTEPDDVVSRWQDWTTAGNVALVSVAEEGRLAAVATLNRMRVLHRPRPVGRITALIVDLHLRGQGIGRALVSAAEQVFASQGCGLLEITSNLRLVEAHRFYEHLGYRRTSIRLAKNLLN